jgi:hypothetical protein
VLTGGDESLADGNGCVVAKISRRTVVFMSLFKNGIPFLIALLVVCGVTVVQGVWTERWSDRNIAGELAAKSKVLVEKFPTRAGAWAVDVNLEADQKALDRAGAVSHISKLYENRDTGMKIAVFVVCATPHAASGHTPDRCYPGAGFEIAETEHREAIALNDGREAEVFVGTFRKTGQLLRIYWSYGVDDRWVAPQLARIELAGSASVYKLYVILDQTGMSAAKAGEVCNGFLAELLPAFSLALKDEGPSGQPAAQPPAGS